MMRNFVFFVKNTLVGIADRQSATYRSVWLFSLALLNTLVQTGCFMLMFDKIGSDEFGQYRSFLSFISFSGLFHLGIADGLFLEWLFQRRKPSIGDLLSIIGVTILLSLPVFLIDQTNTVQWFLVFYLLLANVSFVLNSAYVVSGRYSSALFLNVFVQLMLVLTLLSFGDIGFLTIVTVGLSAQFIGMIWLFGFSLKWDLLTREFGLITFSELKDLLKAGFPVLLIGFFFIAVFNLDKILLIDTFESADFGRYAFATSLVSIGVGILSAPVNLLLKKLIGMSRIELAKAYQLLFVSLWLLGLTALALVPVFFWILNRYSDSYRLAQPFAQSWVAVLFPLLVLQILLVNLYKSYGLQIKLVYAAAVSTLFIFSAIVFCKFRIDGLELLPVLIAQILIVLTMVLDKLLCLDHSNISKHHLKRTVILVVYNVIIWTIYVK